MSDTTTEQTEGQESTEEQTSEETTESTEAEATSHEEETTEDESTEQESEKDELPDWAREKLTKANNEAAKYRTQVKELREKVKALEESSGQVEDLNKKATDASAAAETAKTDLLKLQIALTVDGIEAKNASEFAELLQGTTEEELKAHAEKVKKLLGVSRSRSAVDPTQGRGGKVEQDPGTGTNRLAFAYNSASK